MNKYIKKLRTIKENQNGFSLIELVVAVGILAILSVVGVVAYSKITENARQAAVEAAAAEVYKGAVAYDANGDADAAEKAIKEWKDSSKGSIEVENVGSDDNICITAVMVNHPEANASKGSGCDDTGGNGGDSSSSVPNVDHAKIEVVFDRSDLKGETVEISLYGDQDKLDTVKETMNAGETVVFYDTDVNELGSKYNEYIVEIKSPAGTQTYTVDATNLTSSVQDGITQWTLPSGPITLGDSNMDGVVQPAPITRTRLDVSFDVYSPEHRNEHVEIVIRSNGGFSNVDPTTYLQLDGSGRATAAITLESRSFSESDLEHLELDITIESPYGDNISTNKVEPTVVKVGDNRYSSTFTLN